MMNRSAWIVLAVVVLIAAILIITQSQSLSSTQTQLATAQVNLTKQSDNLDAQATAALVTATQAAAAQAEAVDDAQNEAATARAQALAQVEAQAATMQAVALADAAQAAATTQAAALAAAQSEAAAAQAQAVEDAESQAATAQAQALADAQSKAMTAIAQAVEQVQNRDATAQAQALEEAQNQAATAQAEALSTQSVSSQATITAQAQSQFALLETLNALRNELATAQAASTPGPTSTLAASVYGDIPQARLPDGGFVLGNPDASITVVEFGDYACPHCQNYEQTINQFIDNYVRAGKARFEFRILPTAGREVTQLLGQVQVCFEEQRAGAFWEARSLLAQLAIDGKYDQHSGAVVADQLGLDYAKALECSASDTQMQADIDLAQQSGVQGTPAVLIRRGEGEPQFITLDGMTYDGGGTPYEVLAAVVDASVDAAPAIISQEGWKRFEGNGIALQLPGSWVGGDLANNPELLADAMAALGPEYTQLGQMLLQNPDLMRLMVVDTESKRGFTTNVNVIHQELPIALDLPSFMEITANQLPSNMTVITNEIAQTDFGDTGRLVTQGKFPAGTSQSVQYVLLDNDQVWVVTYTSSAGEFEAMLPIFEASFKTIEFQKTST